MSDAGIEYSVGMRIKEKLANATDEHLRTGTICYVYNGGMGLIIRPDGKNKDAFILTKGRIITEVVETPTKPIPPESDCSHMEYEEFRDCADMGMFTSDDGYGHFATETVMYPETDCMMANENNYTHVVWFNS